MRIQRRITFHCSEHEIVREMERAGVAVDIGEIVNLVLIDEEDPRWPAVEEICRRFKLSSWPETKFSPRECELAYYLFLKPTWHHRYPQPEDDYVELTYDLSLYCAACGAGAEQKAPFRMKAEPKWGRRSILQLNWVFDEYFVTPEAWSGVFAPLGIASGPVMNKSGTAELEPVVQLLVPGRVALQEIESAFEDCPRCGRRKHNHVTPGFSPEPSTPLSNISKSEQLFGSGAGAEREIVVSNQVYRKIRGLAC